MMAIFYFILRTRPARRGRVHNCYYYGLAFLFFIIIASIHFSLFLHMEEVMT